MGKFRFDNASRPDAPPIANPARRLLAGINLRIKHTIEMRDGDIAAIEEAHRARPNSGVMAQMRSHVHASYDKVMDELTMLQSQIEPLADEFDRIQNGPKDPICTASLIETLSMLDALTLARIVAELGAINDTHPVLKFAEAAGRERALVLAGNANRFDTIVDELVNDPNALRQYEGGWIAAQI